MQSKFNSMHFIFIFAILAILGIPSIASLNAQPLSTPMNNMTMQQHAKHILDNLVISQHIPLTGDLVNGDYILLMDVTPFATSVEGHSHIAMKIPCNQDGSPKVTIATGIAPNLKSLEVGKEINNGTLDGRRLDLSDEGNSCLYHALLPKAITDIVLVNTSNETLNFDRGEYSVTVTVHGTAIQHLGANQTGE
ncbi:MAG: hypothetical protein E6L04_05545 [Thaumarchaeota archaeon]|nr:MAG: hypothetical protein E6L04_05545 [Nitrososphaerota archaeon]